MRVLVLTQYYSPEPVEKVHDLARRLVALGHEVEVLTSFPSYPLGRTYAGYAQRLLQREVLDGVRVLRVPQVPDHSRSVPARALYYLSFAFFASLIGAIAPRRPDVLLVEQSTLPIALAGVFIAGVRRVPIVLDIVDLWPESLAASGMIKNRLLIGLVRRGMRLVYRAARHITVVTEGYRQRVLEERVPSSKVSVIYNWTASETAQRAEPDPRTAEREGLAGRFNVMYAGNMGVPQDLETVLSAAAELRDEPRIQFVMVGGGLEHDRLVSLTAERKLTNVRFLGRRSPTEMPSLYALADALLVHLKPDALTEVSIPSKTFAYMAAGKPVVMAVPGDAARLVEKEGIGVAVAPSNPKELARAVRSLFTQPLEARERMGAAALQAHRSRYCGEVQILRMAEVLESAAQRASREKKSRVIVVSCVFTPEPGVSSRTSYDVAAELTARGDEVTVLAPFPNRPAAKVFPGFRRSFFRREKSPDGFGIVRCFSFFSRRSLLVSRLGENVSFGITSALALLMARRPDVVYVNTWPLFATALVVAVARLRGSRVVLSVQDIYPESLVAQRRVGSNLIRRLLMPFDRVITRSADAVVVIAEMFADHYRHTRGVDPAKMHVVPNWLTAEVASDDHAVEESRRRHGIAADAFLLAYGGNVGVSAAVEEIIEAFAYLRDRPDIHLLVAGEGSSLASCRRLAARVAPSQIHFESPWTDTMAILQAANATVLPTHAAQSLSSVPSKLISYLFAERPVVGVALEASETAAIIRRSGSGVVVRPDDPRALAAAIRDLTSRAPEALAQMGKSGRNWALANMTRDVCLPPLLNIIRGTTLQRIR